MKTFCRHLLLFALFCIFYNVSQAQTNNKLNVVTHNKVTIVTDPSKGEHKYSAWGTFPSAGEPIRQIKLKVTFGCPDSLRCADWDYKDHITLCRTGGVNGATQDFEIARMLTPYGGAFAKNWEFAWEVDVTDFSLLLRDSVEIEYNHTGWEPANDRGWKVTLDFEITKGQPAWEPISIQKIYDGSFRYGDSANSIENALRPVTFKTAAGAHFARLRMVQTGHGMDKPDGCGEFCNKYRELWYDGKLIDKKDLWMECGDNPLYPQAGTWIYDRANWCPGVLMQPEIHNLPVHAGAQHTIDVNMQPYVSVEPSADEVLSAYLIQYKKATAKWDVAVEDVMSPSNKHAYQRLNPTLLQPQVVVRNLGSETLNQLTIRYGTRGFAKKNFGWKGSLSSGASTVVTLPGVVDAKGSGDVFEVELLQPNGKRDGYKEDNIFASNFTNVPVQDSILIVYLQTANQPGQTGYTLTNSAGQVVRERGYNTLQANTVYRDTISLKTGDYLFVLRDSADNGLEFWANPRGGRGKARLLNSKGQMVKDFESDFGSFVQYQFKVGEPATPINQQTSFGLYPTRTNDKTTFDYYSNFPENITVQLVTDPGDEVVEEHKYYNLQEGIFTYDLSRFPKGRFYLRVLINGEEKFKKRIRLKE